MRCLLAEFISFFFHVQSAFLHSMPPSCWVPTSFLFPVLSEWQGISFSFFLYLVIYFSHLESPHNFVVLFSSRGTAPVVMIIIPTPPISNHAMRRSSSPPKHTIIYIIIIISIINFSKKKKTNKKITHKKFTHNLFICK